MVLYPPQCPSKSIHYLPYIDNLKGFAILLVIIGHVIQYLTDPYDADNNIVFRYIYSFHMPLFFMISGMMIKESYSGAQVCQTIRKRFLQLILPFTSWAFIWSITVQSHPFYMAYADPNRGPWFLWCLFWIIAIDLVVHLLVGFQHILRSHSIYSCIVISLVVCLVLRYMTSRLQIDFGISTISYQYLFYLIGALLSRYRYTLTASKSAFGGGDFMWNNLSIISIILLS